MLVFGHATDAVMDAVGLGPPYRVDDRRVALHASRRTSATSTRCPPDARLEVRSSVIGVTGKLLWIWHELWCDGRLRATEEVLGVHVDTTAGRSSPFPAELRGAAEALRVPPPEHASRRIALP